MKKTTLLLLIILLSTLMSRSQGRLEEEGGGGGGRQTSTSGFDCSIPIFTGNCNLIFNQNFGPPGRPEFISALATDNLADGWKNSHGTADINRFFNNPPPASYSNYNFIGTGSF